MMVSKILEGEPLHLWYAANLPHMEVLPRNSEMVGDDFRPNLFDQIATGRVSLLGHALWINAPLIKRKRKR